MIKILAVDDERPIAELLRLSLGQVEGVLRRHGKLQTGRSTAPPCRNPVHRSWLPVGRK